MSNGTVRFVNYSTEDRQWDARFNVQRDEDLAELVSNIKRSYESGGIKYVLIGGPEIGTKPYQDDYQIRHIHVAIVYVNRHSKRSILQSWNIKTGNGYYLVPRNRSLPMSGWRSHHIKSFSKIDPAVCVLYEMGTLPADQGPQGETFVKRSDEEKKRKIDDVLIDMRQMIEAGKEEDAWVKFPRTYLQYGEKIKAMVHQKKDNLQSTGDPHIWIYGPPGKGKSAIMNYVYPAYYKKNLYNRFFDLYDPKIHTHIMLEDLDHDAVDQLSITFLKTLCDEAGFAVDQKYKTPQLARATILVTSNFTIPDVVEHSIETNGNSRGPNKFALLRRFWHIHSSELMRLLGLKLLPVYEINVLKKQGNNDPGRLFMTWDYLNDCPLGVPIQSPQHYATLLKDTFYAQAK
uniref:Replication protein n=1 Tax=Psittacidae parvo-like hybrid virus TaxID=2794535 RepID=A0A8A4XDB0_9VIRU|nr:MAG: replication protein [Psittacidae parvo-like hybrid virus]